MKLNASVCVCTCVCVYAVCRCGYLRIMLTGSYLSQIIAQQITNVSFCLGTKSKWLIFCNFTIICEWSQHKMLKYTIARVWTRTKSRIHEQQLQQPCIVQYHVWRRCCTNVWATNLVENSSGINKREQDLLSLSLSFTLSIANGIGEYTDKFI